MVPATWQVTCQGIRQCLLAWCENPRVVAGNTSQRAVRPCSRSQNSLPHHWLRSGKVFSERIAPEIGRIARTAAQVQSGDLDGNTAQFPEQAGNPGTWRDGFSVDSIVQRSQRSGPGSNFLVVSHACQDSLVPSCATILRWRSKLWRESISKLCNWMPGNNDNSKTRETQYRPNLDARGQLRPAEGPKDSGFQPPLDRLKQEPCGFPPVKDGSDKDS